MLTAFNDQLKELRAEVSHKHAVCFIIIFGIPEVDYNKDYLQTIAFVTI